VAYPSDRLRRHAAVGLLARAFTHEFNNVLGGILGSAQLMAMRNDDAQLGERLATIVQSVQRGMALTRAFAGAASACDGGSADAHAVIAELVGSRALESPGADALAARQTLVGMDAEILREVVAALAGIVGGPGPARARTRNAGPPGAAAGGPGGEAWLEIALDGPIAPSERARAVLEDPLRIGPEPEALPLAAAAAAVRMARGRIQAGPGAGVALHLPLA
jgi:hypothetical protein